LKGGGKRDFLNESDAARSWFEASVIKQWGKGETVHGC